MIENSSYGLTLLDPDHEVVVTREEHHQPALLPWAPHADGRGRRVAVELRFAPITHGTHAGQRGVEVRLDGQRVGELTARMSQRYGPLVENVVRGGGRPGCVAMVVHGRRGVEVELRLPDITAGAPVPPPAPPRRPTPPPGPRGSRPGNARRLPPDPRPRRSRKPYWIGAGVATVLLIVAGGIGSHNATVTATSSTAAEVSAGPAVAATTSPSRAEPATTVTPRPAAPTGDTRRTAAVAAPRDEPVPRATSRPVAVPKPTPAPEPPPQAAPANDCDPNYSGCVPIASDVDCAGGSGNGPAYVRGPVTVTGTDIYGLDNDHNGTGCES